MYKYRYIYVDLAKLEQSTIPLKQQPCAFDREIFKYNFISSKYNYRIAGMFGGRKVW